MSERQTDRSVERGGDEEEKVLPHIGRLIATATQTNGSFEVIDYVGPAAPPPRTPACKPDGQTLAQAPLEPK